MRARSYMDRTRNMKGKMMKRSIAPVVFVLLVGGMLPVVAAAAPPAETLHHDADAIRKAQEGVEKWAPVAAEFYVAPDGNDGRVYITKARPKKGDVESIQAFASGGTAKLVGLEVHELKSIWNK